MKVNHIESELCDGTLEGCSDPKHLDYAEMRSTLDQITEEQEKAEPGSSEDVFQITEVKEKLAPYNINNDLMLQLLYQLIVVVKTKVINTTIGFCPPPPVAKAKNDVFCCGPWCYGQGEGQEATHALRWIPEDYKDGRGVICLLCPDDYWASKYDPIYLGKIAKKCLADMERQTKK
jgi:hypothetical protein